MAELSIEPSKLIAAAEDFETSGKSLSEIVEKLDLTTGNLKDDWEGAAKQMFYKQYTEIRQYLQGFAGILNDISDEMKAMVERYSDADH
jgi:WXG100 family type VII secretion target